MLNNIAQSNNFYIIGSLQFKCYNILQDKVQEHRKMEKKNLKDGLNGGNSIYSFERAQDLTQFIENGPQQYAAQGQQQCYDQDGFYTKLTGEQHDSHDISFQRGFMDEHKAAFQKNLWNLMEASRQEEQNPQIQYLKHVKTGFESKGSQSRFSKHPILQPQQCFISLKELNKKYLKQEKVAQFLKYVWTFVVQDIAIELAQIANHTLQTSASIIKEPQSQQQIVKKGKQVGKEISNNPLFGKKIGADRAKTHINYQEFLKAFCSTVLLISAQYFTNPYCQDEQDESLKRYIDLSNGQDYQQSFEIKPRKLRKYSL